jgi:hypothetical protein
MGYNIEVSFNVLKQSNVGEVKDHIIDLAIEKGCEFYFEDFEFEKNRQYQRNHCVITLHFSSGIDSVVQFLKIIHKTKGVFIETIFQDENSQLLYASRYYITQMMDKHIAKKYQIRRKERSYSEDDTLILQSIQKWENN